MSNKEISKKFRLLAALMELHDENAFKIKSYTNAAYAIERLSSAVADLPPHELSAVQGIGTAIGEKIAALLDKGSFPLLDQLLCKTPDGIVEMLAIKGIGPKKIKVLWQELGVENRGELLYACNENRLVALSGFGTKTQDNIRQSIEYAQANASKFRYATLVDEVQQWLAKIRVLPQIARAETSGELRRQCEVLSEATILLAPTETLDETAQAALSQQIVELLPETSLLRHWAGTRVAWTNLDVFERTWFLQTAHPDHLQQLGGAAALAHLNATTETDIYAQLDLPYLPPELREGRQEIAFARQQSLTDLVQLNHLRGVIHAHSTYSDGRHTLQKMAEHCRQAGYDYLGISDHSKAAFYANGLSVERVAEQHREIDELNQQLAPFRIFKGIEADILNDGALDYDSETLSRFDFVIASVHSNLKMTEEKAMNRLLRAIENPYTRLLGHPTGRLLLSREGYPIDHRRIIDACAANNVAIELNANPYRLDIDWRWIDYCTEKGVWISINPDAHSIEGISDMQYGVIAARKGLLTRALTLNAQGIAHVAAFFARQ